MGYSGGLVDLSDHELDEPAAYDLESMTIKNQKLKLMYNHRTTVGHTDSIENSGAKISGRATLSIENKITKKIKNAAGNEFPFEMSLGMDARKVKVIYFPTGTVVNGRTFTKAMYLIKNTIVDEVTITETGRDSKTSMRLLNSKLSKAELSLIKNIKPAPKPPKVPTKVPVKSPTKSPTRKKISNAPPAKDEPVMPKITLGTAFRLNNKYPEAQDIVQKGLDNDWSKARILNAIKMRRLENQLPTPVKVGKAGDASDKVMEARVVSAIIDGESREKVLIKRYGEQVAERVLNSPMIGIKEWLVMSARRMGENSFSGHSDISRLTNFIGRYNKSFTGSRINNVGFSSFDMPNFFNRVTSITMEEAWKLSGFFAKEMCYKTSQSNFNKTQRFRPSGGQMWEGLDKDGKIKHTSFGEEQSYETSLDTKAQILMLDRVTIKNDDFGAVREMITLMLEGSMMVPDYKLVQHMLQAQGAFFTAYAADTVTGGNGTGNDYQDAAAALTETSLAFAYDLASERIIDKKAVKWLQDIGDSWTIVVPTNAMERVAYDIIEQKEYVGNSTANTKQVKNNFWYKRFAVKKFPQLANLSFHEDAKRTNWFLWPSDPKNAPFALNWLDGVERPTVETVDAPVDMLGFGTRGYIDVDVNDREPDAIVRMRPEA